jgi:hypothetical protein
MHSVPEYAGIRCRNIQAFQVLPEYFKHSMPDYAGVFCYHPVLALLLWCSNSGMK